MHPHNGLAAVADDFIPLKCRDVTLDAALFLPLLEDFCFDLVNNRIAFPSLNSPPNAGNSNFFRIFHILCWTSANFVAKINPVGGSSENAFGPLRTLIKGKHETPSPELPGFISSLFLPGITRMRVWCAEALEDFSMQR